MQILNFIRSLIFNIFFTIESLIIAFVCIPIYFLNKKYVKYIGKIWAFITLGGLKYICRLDYRIEGEIPRHPVLIASKHQSAMECIIFWRIFDYPKFILKQELTKIPLVGWCFRMMDMIIISRESLKDLMVLIPKSVKNATIDESRTVILFPEGTRIEYGAKTECKAALAILQKNNNFLDIYPVAINTGKFWGKNSFIKKSGIATIKFLPMLDREISYKDINKEVEKLLDENVM